METMNAIYKDNAFTTDVCWYIFCSLLAYQFDTYIDRNLHKS